MANRRVAVAKMGHARNPGCRCPGQSIPQFRFHIHKGRSRQVQPEHFGQELIGVGCSIKGAGSYAVIGPALVFKHLIPADFSLGKELSGSGLLLVWEP